MITLKVNKIAIKGVLGNSDSRNLELNFGAKLVKFLVLTQIPKLGVKEFPNILFKCLFDSSFVLSKHPKLVNSHKRSYKTFA